MPISDNELIRELVTGGMDERAAKALLTRLSAASGVGQPVVRAFQFAFDTPSLNTGVDVYTPTVGDILLNAWVEVTEAWDGTTPKCDYGLFTSDHFGWSGFDGDGAIPLDIADVVGDNVTTAEGLFGVLGAGASSRKDLVSGVSASASRQLPAKFVTANPVKVVVSQTGQDNGAATGSTQGSAILYLVTATPAF